MHLPLLEGEQLQIFKHNYFKIITLKSLPTAMGYVGVAFKKRLTLAKAC
jgi:hypothetical protein